MDQANTEQAPELGPEIRAQMVEVLRKHGVTHAGLLGFFARSAEDTAGELEVLIDPPRNMTLLGLAALENDLEDLLGLPVNPVSIGGLRPSERENALSKQEALF